MADDEPLLAGSGLWKFDCLGSARNVHVLGLEAEVEGHLVDVEPAHFGLTQDYSEGLNSGIAPLRTHRRKPRILRP